jgi:hypothetical protein
LGVERQLLAAIGFPITAIPRDYGDPGDSN